MALIDGRSDPRQSGADAAEYSGDVSSRHRARAQHASGRRLRLAYFGVASLWGFVAGIAGVFAAMQSEGQMFIPSGANLSTYAGVGAIVAIGGGAVIAGAYQEAKRRR
jgi:hypothetical protein